MAERRLMTSPLFSDNVERGIDEGDYSQIRKDIMKVLIVDDNEDFLKVMEQLLQGYGHTALVASDGKIAREILEDQAMDVVISDVFMPTLDGVRFHSYVREFLGARDMPFIFMSGYDDPYTQEALEDSAVDFFISKTSPVTEIIERLEKIQNSIHA
jgi:CheY-like chemotaxis protein